MIKSANFTHPPVADPARLCCLPLADHSSLPGAREGRRKGEVRSLLLSSRGGNPKGVREAEAPSSPSPPLRERRREAREGGE